MEYLEEADDSLFADLVRQWIDANPPYARGYWKDSWNSYTVSLRTVVWMQQLASRGARLDAATREAAVASLAQQIRFLEANLETDIGGNHLIKNIKALLLASAFFAGSEAEQWRALGLRLLAEELARASLGGWDALRAFAVLPLPGFRRPAGMPAGAWRRSVERRARRRAGADGAGRGRPLPSRRPRRAFQRRGPFHGLFAGGMPRRLCAPLRTKARAATDYSLSRTPAISGCGATRPISSSIADASLPTNFRRMVMATWRSFELSVARTTRLRRSRRLRILHWRATPTLAFRREPQHALFRRRRSGGLLWLLSMRTQAERRGSGATKPETMASRSRRHMTAFAIFPARPATSGASSVAADRIEIEDRIEGTTDRPASIGFLLHPAVVAEVLGHEARLRLGPLDIILSSSRPIDMEDAVWWPDMGVERQTQRLRIGFPPGAETVTTAIRLSHTTDGFGQNT